MITDMLLIIKSNKFFQNCDKLYIPKKFINAALTYILRVHLHILFDSYLQHHSNSKYTVLNHIVNIFPAQKLALKYIYIYVIYIL